MPLVLEPRAPLPLAIDLAAVLPEKLTSAAAVADCRVRLGRQMLPLEELFHVSGSAADDLTLLLRGDFSRGHSVGQGMTQGTIRAEGNLGRHAGQSMRGGSLEVQGDASDYLGCDMRGGAIRVRGNAGDFTAGALPGSTRGMRGGTILVQGAAGRRTAEAMRRGLVIIQGPSGDYAGFRMLAGTIVLGSGGGMGHGSGMKRGTIAILAPLREPMLPTFVAGATQELLVMKLLARELRKFQASELDATADRLCMPLAMWHGDLLAGGRGELLLAL